MFGVNALGGSRIGGAGGFAGWMFPGVGFTIITPEPLLVSARWMRIHRKIMKDVLKTVLTEWHANILGKHFEPGAKQKYGHQARQETTKRIKEAKYRHNTDLVQSGRTARKMKSRVPRVSISGTGDRYLEGKISYRFPFPVSRDAKDPRFVTIAKMAGEIGTWTNEEMKWAIDRFAELYAKETEFYLSRAPKMRIQIQQKRLF